LALVGCSKDRRGQREEEPLAVHAQLHQALATLLDQPSGALGREPVAQHGVRRTDGGVAGKRDLAARGEDPQPIVRRRVGRGADEGRLGKFAPPRDLVHGRGRQRRPLEVYRHWVALEGHGGEDVHLLESDSDHGRSPPGSRGVGGAIRREKDKYILPAMDDAWRRLVEQIHDSGRRVTLVITGGGSGAIGELLRVPGGSRTLVEAIVPYDGAALAGFWAGGPAQACSEEAATAIACRARERVRAIAPEATAAVGLGATASLASDRPKKGEHRCHIAVATEGGIHVTSI